MGRTEQHEPRARAADFRTRQQQGDVVGLRVPPALLEAVRRALRTKLLAAATAIDTLLHASVELMSHDFLLRGTRVRDDRLNAAVNTTTRAAQTPPLVLSS
jgi:hypothetical protein